MVKKTKEGTLNLYNFNAHDEEEKKKNKKSKNNKKTKKRVAKRDNIKDKNINNKFDFNNEIVIGLPKDEDISKETNKKTKKRVKVEKQKNIKQKNTKNNKKVKKNVPKKKQRIKTKKTKRNLKIVKYSFLSICIVIAIIAAMTSPLFNIKEIIVEGNEKITKDEIISLSQIKIDENTYKINMSKAQEKILENPYIKSVKIKRVLPSKVSILVEERKATFMFEYGSGYVYINNQGYILEVSSEKLEVPIIQGAETLAEEFVPGNRLCTNDLEKMSTIIKIMEVASNNDIANLITRIDIENSQNYKILFESEEKIAYLGDATNLNDKMPRIVAILNQEKGVAGEIFVNMDLKNSNPIFRQSV